MFYILMSGYLYAQGDYNLFLNEEDLIIGHHHRILRLHLAQTRRHLVRRKLLRRQ